MKHTVVFSDLHLSLEEPGRGVWMRFRQRRFFIDDDFTALVERILEQTAGEPLEVVFNGDTFELDGANAYRRKAAERPEDEGNEAAESLALDRILRDHPVFVAALGRLLDRAERVVFVAGNHDLGLYWPTSRQVLRRHLVRAARRAGSGYSAPALRKRVCFRQWFHRTRDGVYVEHGQQHDPAAATPDPLLPIRRDGRGLWQSFGSAGYRHILGGIGTMNPHSNGSFLLGGLLGYVRHYLRYSCGQGHSLVSTWFFGALRCTRHMLGQHRAGIEPSTAARMDALAAQASGAALPTTTLRQLRELHARPLSNHPFAILHELWLDRLALFGLAALAVAATALLAPLLVTLTVLALVTGGLITYARLAPDNDLKAYEAGLGGVATRIARLTGDRVVVFGHTHRAQRKQLSGNVTLINTGSWAPSFADPECTRPVDSERTYAWIRSSLGQVTTASLLTWNAGDIETHEPRPVPATPLATETLALHDAA
ncbi:MAG: metallophosphoesterase [bacterium]